MGERRRNIIDIAKWQPAFGGHAQLSDCLGVFVRQLSLLDLNHHDYVAANLSCIRKSRSSTISDPRWNAGVDLAK
jgi:hypothetical protein